MPAGKTAAIPQAGSRGGVVKRGGQAGHAAEEEAAWAAHILDALRAESSKLPGKASLQCGRSGGLSTTSVKRALGLASLTRSESPASVGSQLQSSGPLVHGKAVPNTPPAPSSLDSTAEFTSRFPASVAAPPPAPRPGMPALDMVRVRMGYDDDEDSCLSSLNLVGGGPIGSKLGPVAAQQAAVPQLNIAALPRSNSVASVGDAPALLRDAAMRLQQSGQGDQAAAASPVSDMASTLCLGRLREAPLHATTLSQSQSLVTPPRSLSHTMRGSAFAAQLSPLPAPGVRRQGSKIAPPAELGRRSPAPNARRGAPPGRGRQLARAHGKGKHVALPPTADGAGAGMWHVPHVQSLPRLLPPLVAHVHNHIHHHHHVLVPSRGQGEGREAAPPTQREAVAVLEETALAAQAS